MREARACPCLNVSPIQARNTKFGSEVQIILIIDPHCCSLFGGWGGGVGGEVVGWWGVGDGGGFDPGYQGKIELQI